ncbi:hypothetical protein [Actinomadura sp. K4S16]|uniref:hypothetical protein n=1 Tax=Actinomadura sp. K4S16 TaxID=1316147 RepID=UPI00190F5EE8|nr:hypothetical protein [Actinomadura sp. K4S16]
MTGAAARSLSGSMPWAANASGDSTAAAGRGVGELDALDLFSMLSLVHRRLDAATTWTGSWPAWHPQPPAGRRSVKVRGH